jgi:V/A-type H+-transporting ATPase subunit D
MELTRLKKKLATARRGHKLLKDKRDELMRRFLELVKENKALREKVEKGISAANLDFALAAAVMGGASVKTALLAPKQDISVNVELKNIMSVEVPVFDYKTRTADSGDMYSYGFLTTSSELDEAVASLAAVFPDMLRLAESEKACTLMAAEIERTRRRVNALEHVMIPDYTEKIRYISMKLDENERSTQIRLLKVKDMIYEKNHAARREA